MIAQTDGVRRSESPIISSGTVHPGKARRPWAFLVLVVAAGLAAPFVGVRPAFGMASLGLGGFFALRRWRRGRRP